MKEGFIECDTCRAKPGSPTLCSGCLHNRDVITKLEEIVHEGYKFEPTMPTPHTDQFEEMKEEFEIWWKFECVDYPPCEKIAEWWLSKLHHIRRETEKGMMEICVKCSKKEGFSSIEKMAGYQQAIRDILSHLESDSTSPQVEKVENNEVK